MLVIDPRSWILNPRFWGLKTERSTLRYRGQSKVVSPLPTYVIFPVNSRRYLVHTKNLIEITRWSHIVLEEVLNPGDLAVDLTVGNGKDTLFLRKTVGPEGCIVGFDIQLEALMSARSLLSDAGITVTICEEGDARPGLPVPGVHLFNTDHTGWPGIISGSPKAVIANLGYLPGGDRKIVTRTESTLAALEVALDKLSSGGRIAVVCYVVHEGGREEADAVKRLFGELDQKQFRVLKIMNHLADSSPFLMAVEKL